MKQKYPHVRPVTEDDYPIVWSIWMQDRVICWMSFPKQNLKDFRSRYEKLRSTSDIYVMVDYIDGKEEVVGVRRIKYLQGNQSHIAEFCSMGIDAKRQGKGYGGKFYEEFEKIVTEKKHIKRIQITQSGGNEVAFYLGDKNKYQEEAVFPDWLEREGKDKYHYFVIERFIYKIIDTELQTQATKLPSLTYKAKLPHLNRNLSEQNLKVSLEDNKLIVKLDENLILATEYYPDDSVIQHIGFLKNPMLFQDRQFAQAAMREALIFILKQGRVKKLELYTSNPLIVSLCQDLGFFVRGERVASYYHEGQYQNELGVEYSFFDIKEALDFLKGFDLIKESPALEPSLLECQQVIEQYHKDGTCDELGSKYLQNIVYQMVRDSLRDEKLTSLQKQPWQAVIEECPKKFQIAVLNLNKILLSTNMQKNKLQTSSSFFQQTTTMGSENNNTITTFAPTNNKLINDSFFSTPTCINS